ncbi:MAG TPA: bifunctional 4-hydroxy-2-oxoglutarate aldolase/2-dehydro-3-deoxy-phosphogluconate aldolase [Candidatus Methylacidiphilales bacterium]
MGKAQIIERILHPGVVAIIRADSSEQLIEASRALIEGGIPGIEITMTTPDALKVIADVRRTFGDQALVGVGSVLDVATAQAAIEAGAEYVVTPVLKPEVIAFCNQMEKPILAGVYTPTEAQTATELGADFVKLFPADGLGPAYVRAIRGPLPHLRIVPTGGVDLNTAGDFIQAGCVAVAAGSSLVSKEILKNRDWAKLKDLAAQFVAAVAHARKK